MDVRGLHNPWVQAAVHRLEALNARHPWSHNEHFHPWLLRRLPDERRVAVDVGCGQGLLVSRLAPHFATVLGTDVDAGMRQQAAERCAPLPNVRISGQELADLAGPVDLVTMVAVLHHLDAEQALLQVRRLLAPGGRLLVVGLAPPATATDLLWDVASAVTTPVIGLVKHPRPVRGPVAPDPFPVADPTLTVRDLRVVLDRVLPGARLRHRLAFRHTIEWTAPEHTR